MRQQRGQVVDRRLLAVHHAEPVAHVHIAQFGEPGSETGPFGIILRSLRGLEPDVLEQRHATVRQRAHGRGRRRADEIGGERDLLAQQLREPDPDHVQRRAARGALGVVRALRAAEVGHDDDPGAAVRQLLDHRQAGADTSVVGDLTAAFKVERHVQVGPQQDAAPGDVDVIDRAHVRYASRDATSAVRSASRQEKPHSLSYQPNTFTWLPYAIVIEESNVHEAGEPTMSEDTIGSSV